MNIVASHSKADQPHTPTLFKNVAGEITSGFMIEHFFESDAGIKIVGWCIGSLDVRLYCDGAPVDFQLTRISRADVCSVFSQPSSDPNLGYTLAAPVRAGAWRLEWIAATEAEQTRVQYDLGKPQPQPEEKALRHSMGQISATSGIITSKITPTNHVNRRIFFDRFVGCMAIGWAVCDGVGGAVVVSLDAQVLGQIEPNVIRPDVNAEVGQSDAKLGFVSMLGGILQFALLARKTPPLNLSLSNDPSVSCQIDLGGWRAEAHTFSPLRAFTRRSEGASLGKILALRHLTMRDISVLFQLGDAQKEADNTTQLACYQRDADGRIHRVGGFFAQANGQTIAFDISLRSLAQPVLVVVSDGRRHIRLTDCIPLPTLFADQFLPLIEYHSFLHGGGKSALDVVARMSRNYFNWATQPTGTTRVALDKIPTRAKCTVVLYSEDDFDPLLESELSTYKSVSDQVVFLDTVGRIQSTSGPAAPLLEYLDSSSSDFLLLCPLSADIRPDFWAVMNRAAARFSDDTQLAFWSSVFIDGVARPCIVRHNFMHDPKLMNEPLLDVSGVVVTMKLFKQALATNPDEFRSGRLNLAKAFCHTPASQCVNLAEIMEIRQLRIQPSQLVHYRGEHAPIKLLPMTATDDNDAYDVSVIINFRDSAGATMRCLSSIALQKFKGQIQLILVNNCSLLENVQKVVAHATRLFGEANVDVVDYEGAFNHSEQCNIAAGRARHEYLLMFSNDSVFITPCALQRACMLASIPEIASCGFRVIGTVDGKTKLQSMGLAVNPRMNLLLGASPVTSGHPPSFAWDYTIEVIGNTFAAVVLKRDMYLELQGLDSEAFPTSFNDVDFCVRASIARYRHIVIGSEIVEHMAHGSRDFEFDLPVDRRILERMSSLASLTEIGFGYL